MKNLSIREKIFLIVLSLVLIFYVYYSFFLSKMLDKISISKTNIQNYTVEVDKIKNATAINEKLNRELNESKIKFIEDVKKLPELERNPEIAYNAKVLGDKNSFLLNGITFTEPAVFSISSPSSASANNTSNEQNKNEPKLYIVPVSITSTGGYLSTMGFISSVEGDTRIAEINNININSTQDGKLNVGINLNYYYYEGKINKEIKYDFNNGTYGKGDLFR